MKLFYYVESCEIGNWCSELEIRNSECFKALLEVSSFNKNAYVFLMLNFENRLKNRFTMSQMAHLLF